MKLESSSDQNFQFRWVRGTDRPYFGSLKEKRAETNLFTKTCYLNFEYIILERNKFIWTISGILCWKSIKQGNMSLNQCFDRFK